jgi:hypothetical protein
MVDVVMKEKVREAMVKEIMALKVEILMLIVHQIEALNQEQMNTGDEWQKATKLLKELHSSSYFLNFLVFNISGASSEFHFTSIHLFCYNFTCNLYSALSRKSFISCYIA